MTTSIVLTCEHATNHVPEDFKKVFVKKLIPSHYNLKEIDEVMSEHWAHDIGALDVAEALSKLTKNKLHDFPVSRLLIEGNRYLHKSFFSTFSKELSREHKEHLKSFYWKPHVDRVINAINNGLGKSEHVLHLGIHSFTPVMHGKVRDCDVGILFDTVRKREKEFARFIQDFLRKELPDLVIRRNYPYSGATEGLTKLLRKRFSDSKYSGIEIEINNKHLRSENKVRSKIINALNRTINAIQETN
jgi:predicted N-formylglutamate amidohydrolase